MNSSGMRTHGAPGLVAARAGVRAYFAPVEGQRYTG
jgi:hypothetical protein